MIHDNGPRNTGYLVIYLLSSINLQLCSYAKKMLPDFFFIDLQYSNIFFPIRDIWVQGPDCPLIHGTSIPRPRTPIDPVSMAERYWGDPRGMDPVRACYCFTVNVSDSSASESVPIKTSNSPGSDTKSSCAL